MAAAKLLCALGWLVGAPATSAAQVASFDCAKTQLAAEIAICAVAALGAKDIQAAALYQVLISVKPAWSGMAYREFRDNERDRQAHWVSAVRNACEADVACLRQAYDSRIGALTVTISRNLGLTYGRMCGEGD